MDSKDEMELIKLAIQQLIDKKRSKASSDTVVAEDEDQLLLSRLLSQLESLKNGSISSKPPEPPAETKEEPSSTAAKVKENETVGDGITEIGTEEIVKELRRVKRQNSITHWLLSTMIVLTAVWQFSEVSLVLSLKNTLNNPFRCVTSMISGMMKGNGKNEPDLHQLEAPQLPALNVRGFPHVDLPALVWDTEED